MIDKQLVGAIVAGDLRQYQLNTDDARLIIANRIATPVNRLLVLGYAYAEPPAKELLDQASKRALMSSITQAFTSKRVALILDEAGVPALTYKGVALAMEMQGDWRGRESTDVDVLIAPADVDRAHQALLRAGLERLDGVTSPPGAFHRFRSFEIPYGGFPVTLDLHWHLESPGYYKVPFHELWERRKRIFGDGLDVWAPSRVDMLLIAAPHGTREGWRSLRHIVDFAKLAAETNDSEWDLADRLSRYGPRRSLAVALGVAEACGVEGLPAKPGDWARTMAEKYLVDVDTSLACAATLGVGVDRTPRAAARRRLLRWQVAPNEHVAADALLRSIMRQIGYGKRSWEWELC